MIVPHQLEKSACIYVCASYLVCNQALFHQKEPGSNAITTEFDEELKLNISQYGTVKTYSFLIGMEDVNSIIYTIGCLSKLIPEIINNGKSCTIRGDCSIFVKTLNVLPYEESLMKMAKLESLIGEIPSEILKNYKMEGLLEEKKNSL
ncbi:hypothetical protein ACTFIR_007678 [Dictyostelium discoideum]